LHDSHLVNIAKFALEIFHSDMYVCCHISGLQIYYLSSANSNGADENCEQLGWKKLQDYDPSQKHWKYLNDLAEGNATPEDTISIEDELEEENYYASLPFAALFSFLKVMHVLSNFIMSFFFSLIII
jgi:proteasome assembly chaperone 2